MEITKRIKINAKPEMIYGALVSPHGLTSWLSKDGEIGLEEGAIHKIFLDVEGKPNEIDFRIERLVPQKEVKWSCVQHRYQEWIKSEITFKIDSDNHLVFVQNNIQQTSNTNERVEKASKGWEYFLNNLKQFCETGESHPW